MILRTSGKVFRPSIPTIIKGTLTGVRISAVDAGAFLDNCADVLPYVDGKSIIRLKDADGKSNIAILGAPGTGETYLERLNDTGFDDGSKWIQGAGWSLAGSKGVGNTASNQAISQVSSTEIGRLFLTSYDVVTYTGTASQKININCTGTVGTLRSTTGTFAQYLVGSANSNVFSLFGVFGFGFVGTVDNFSVKQVLTPSIQGCTLLNAPGGAQSFISKDAAFTYNAASYTYEIFTTLRIANPRSIMGVNTFRN
jgi:hypothetical protein